MTENLKTTIGEIEDLLFPQLELSVWERAMYYHLYRQTHLRDTRSITASLSTISGALKISETKARETIRSLDAKGCIDIERSRKGHRIEVFLPRDLELTRKEEQAKVIDIETTDFYSRVLWCRPGSVQTVRAVVLSHVTPPGACSGARSTQDQCR